MNLELFIAKRIHFAKQEGEKRVSSPAIKIAIAGVAIGLAAMILSVAIVVGFKKEVRNKVVGFGSHIQISNFENNNSYEMQPISVNDTILDYLKATEGIKHVDVFATKPGIVKTDKDFQGVILKGISTDYDWNFFRQNMIAGDTLNMSDTVSVNEAIISKNIASKLNLNLGDKFVTYFVQEPIKARSFVITGIYSTNFEEYDKMFIITKLDLIQKLNNWDKDQVSGMEMLVDDYDKLDEIKQNVLVDMMAFQDRNGNTFYTKSIKDMNPMIFNWLDLLDMNVWVIIILMLAISCFTMISGLLIIILERTNMIGMLKTMGARNTNIRKVFLYVSSFLILRGMLWGNVIACAILFIQKQFGVIKLDPDTYYVSEMPVDINILYFLLINIGTLLVSVFMMVGPSYLIAKISPAKSIRYE